eukprot:TRINITY_DN865_c0_g2_i1.p1 TRINITY_DN865_c0_g2~~TRINITY_DN865_c0_g2_i1.p1  ORF type:complete len:1099 (-),score=249.89 TRINITY_DN865_c0_g2_i1:13-2826(-)
MLQEAYNLRIEELLVIDIKFLHNCAQPTIVVLYQDTKEARHVKTYELSLAQKDIREGPWNLPNVENSSEMLIALPFGGALVVGEQSIVYHNGEAFSSLAMKPTTMKAFGFIDTGRILLGDFWGNLHILFVEQNQKKVTMKLEVVGQTSSPSTLSYLDNDLVFVGSTFGDSELVKLEKNPETGENVTCLEKFTNLGPIVDFCVVDMDRQGQGQVVTCSGAFKDGSLRVVRNGIAINEHAQLELPGIKGIWYLQPPSLNPSEKYLVMSFVGETRVLSMSGDNLEEVEIEGLQLDQQTIYCSNVTGGDQYIQVTTKGVYLVNAATEKKTASWAPRDAGDSITVCSCNSEQIILATGGVNLVLLEVSDSNLTFVGTTKMSHEISCLNINPVGVSNNKKARMCAVGLWSDISIKILAIPDFQEIRSVPIEGEIIPRSVLFYTFDDVTYLFIALGDGHLITYTYDLNSGELQNKKQVSIGTQPVTLIPFLSKGVHNIFACSDHPTVIYQSTNNKQLMYSNVNLKGVSHMCDFNCPSFPESLALSTGNSLTIGSIDDIQKLHVQTIPLGEMPKRIQHNPQLKSYVVTTSKIEEDKETHWIKLINDQTFEVMDSYPLQPFEESCSLMTTSSKDKRSDKGYFVVGTAITLSHESEPNKGRILVFSVNDGKLRLETETSVRGAAYSVVDFNGKILVGVNSKVQMLAWTEQENGVHELYTECEHMGHILALYLDTKGDFILVGDMMKSVSLLCYSPVERVIKEVARDYNSKWTTAVAMLNDEHFLGAENNFNLFTVAKNSVADLDSEERKRLAVTGEYHLGEFVNRFREGSLVMKMPAGEGLSFPTLLFGTVNGVIGVVATLDAENFKLCKRLEEALVKVIHGVGGLSHTEWRSNEYKNSQSYGFVDGNLVESFLELSSPQMALVAKEMSLNIEDLVQSLETLVRAIH